MLKVLVFYLAAFDAPCCSQRVNRRLRTDPLNGPSDRETGDRGGTQVFRSRPFFFPGGFLQNHRH